MASKRGRPITGADVQCIKIAIGHLLEARIALRLAGSHNAAEYVQRALKSAQGARNHAAGRLLSDRGVSRG